MASVIDEEVTSDTMVDHQDNETAEVRIDEVAGSLAVSHIGIRLQRGRPRYQRQFKADQIAEAVSGFGAERNAVSMSKKLFDAKEPAVKALRAVYAEIEDVFTNQEYTLPCPTEPKTRLIKRGMVDIVDARLTELQTKLKSAAARLNRELPAIIERQRVKLSRLFDYSDYAFDAEAACTVTWDFPPVHLIDSALSKKAYERQAERIKEMFRLSCKQKEDEMAAGVYEMLENLATALETGPDGKRKVFRDATANKLTEALNHAAKQAEENGIGTGPLAQVFDQIRQTITSRREQLPQSLREGVDEFREHIRAQCLRAATAIASVAEVPVRRAILRRNKSAEA